MFVGLRVRALVGEEPACIASPYAVKPGERYQFKVLGYRETAQNAKLYVKHSSGDIIWSTGTSLPEGLANETWSTNEFIVPANVNQVTVGVRWDNPTNNAVNGATMYINQTALYKMDWEYQYFLEDHVGSPRVVFSTNPSTQRYTATFETENQTTENTQFFNIRPLNMTAHLSNVTPDGSKVISMDKNYRVGPSRSLKVYPGDQIDASVSAYYASMSSLSPAPTADMIGALAQVMTDGGVMGFDGGILSAYNTSAGGGNPLVFALSPDNGGSKPSAFLNYILFDENYQPLEAKSVSVGPNAGEIHLLSFSTAFGSPISVKEVGYMFVYLSYDNENSTPVYFDDLKIVHTESPMVQVNDYYPFGLTAYSWIREGEYENRFLYQGKELDSKTGWQDFHARQYDASLGRWFVMDPAGQFSSPYNGMGNNPVMGIDPDGRFWNFVIGAGIGGVSSYIGGRAAGLRGWDLAGFTIAGAGIGAITSGAGSAVSASVSSSLGTGFVAGAAGGAAGGAVGGFVGGFSGASLANAYGLSNVNPFKSGLKAAAFGITIGGFAGGLSEGLKSIKHGGNFWSGNQATFDAEGVSINDYSPDEALEYSSKYAKEFSDEHFGKIEGLTNLYADGTAPEGYTFKGDEVFNKSGAPVLGTTKYLGTGKGSNVYLYKGAFVSRARLYVTMGHEYIHVGHFNASLFNRNFSEHAAFSWEVAQGKALGLIKWDETLNTKYLNPNFYNALYDYTKFSPPIINAFWGN